jgi:hypothetical protein
MPHLEINANAPSRIRRAVAWWFTDPSTGEVVLWQAPNATMAVIQAANVVQRLDRFPERQREIEWIKTGALVLWSIDEIVRGSTPFRRVLGATVLGFQVRRLMR